MTTQQLMTPAALAARLSVSLPSLRHMRRSGVLPPAVRVGKHLRWRPDVVEAWLSERTEDTHQ